MKYISSLAIALPFLLSPLAAAEQKSNLDFMQRFLLLETNQVSTMQKELNQAATAGYRIVGSHSGSGGLRILLEKVAGASSTHEYLFLSTNRAKTFGKELNEAVAKGFRLIPTTLMFTIPNREIAGVMEKTNTDPTHLYYQVLKTGRTSTMEKELIEAVEEGYKPVAGTSQIGAGRGLVSALGSGFLMVLERSGESSIEQSEGKYLVRGSKAKIKEVAGTGYRVMFGSAGWRYGWALLERTDAAADSAYEYLEVKPKEKKINEAAAEGYRVVPRMMGTDGLMMERTSGSPEHCQYKLIWWKDIPESLAEAVEEGYKVVGLVGHWLLVEKALEGTDPAT